MVRDPQSGRYRRTRLFVMTLGYSRKCVRLTAFHSSTRAWAEMHETAFVRLGGTPRVLILDNLREGVLKARHLRSSDQSAVSRQAGSLPSDCRAVSSESAMLQRVGHARKTPLKGQCFEALPEAQTSEPPISSRDLQGRSRFASSIRAIDSRVPGS
jgi:hypothetical protein